jgi:hypothetical protein
LEWDSSWDYLPEQWDGEKRNIGEREVGGYIGLEGAKRNGEVWCGEGRGVDESFGVIVEAVACLQSVCSVRRL